MKKRQGVAEHIRFADFPDLNDVSGVMNEVCMGKNGALGLAGGAVLKKTLRMSSAEIYLPNLARIYR